MKKFIVFSFACVALCACEEFLTQENPNKIESEYYFKDEASLEIYTNGLVRSFATGIKSFVEGDYRSDTHAWDGSAAYFMDNYSADDASNWGTSNWSQLRAINFYLDNMREAEASDAVMNHYEGVGRFFRALFYYAKVRTFGAVPWYETSIESDDKEALYKDRDNREYVCRKILDDLNYACTYCLTDASYRNQASYIHRYVALALKARFCLYEGTMRKYHAVDPSTGQPWQSDESGMYLRECVAACEEIIRSKVYSLTDNVAERQTQYRAMFISSDATSAYGNEIIWARNYDSELNVTHYMNSYFINQQYANFAFTRQFINTYLMLDGTPFTDKYPDYNSVDFATECTGRDYRLAQTIRTPGFTRDGGKTQWAPDVTFSKTGYQPIKWLTDDSSKDTNTSQCDNDVPLMRYAEVLLNWIEAKEMRGDAITQPDIDKSINLLRDRVGADKMVLTTLKAYGLDLRDEIRRERRVELALEGERYFDLMRWKQGDLLAKDVTGMRKSTVPASEYEYVKDIPTDSEGNLILMEGRTFFEKNYLWPIPFTQTQRNPNLLPNNPGW